jgi:anti-anti-sigma regulatory factor
MRGEAADARWLADQVWSLLEQNLAHRVVLELTEIGPLDSALVEQIIDLSDRIRGCDGLMRVCGLSRRNQQVFAAEGLESRASSYADREAAVMGWARPEKPR